MYRILTARAGMLAATLLLFAAAPGHAASPLVAGTAPTADVRGIYLVAPYPAITVTAGEMASIDLKLRNYGNAPEPLALSVTGLPQGWTAEFIGNNQTVAAAMAATGDATDLQLRVDVPKGATAAATALVVHADGGDTHASLPITLTTGKTLPLNLALSAQLPSLRGSPTASFSYTLDLHNNSGVDVVASLGADTPPAFQASFTKQYDSQEISTLPIQAGKSATLTMKVSLPNTVKAGSYKLAAHVSGSGVTATAPLTLDVIGQPTLILTTKDGGRLSGDAVAGDATPILFQLQNTGSAPAHNINLSANPPTDWKIDFTPPKIDELAPGAKLAVQMVETPAAKAVAGDYMTTISANAEGNSTSVDYRTTVTTSTLWGIVGIALIAIALLAVLGVVARFGRR